MFYCSVVNYITILTLFQVSFLTLESVSRLIWWSSTLLLQDLQEQITGLVWTRIKNIITSCLKTLNLSSLYLKIIQEATSRWIFYSSSALNINISIPVGLFMWFKMKDIYSCYWEDSHPLPENENGLWSKNNKLSWKK